MGCNSWIPREDGYEPGFLCVQDRGYFKIINEYCAVLIELEY